MREGKEEDGVAVGNAEDKGDKHEEGILAMGVGKIGYSGLKVTRILGVITSSKKRWAASEGIANLKKHLMTF